MKKSELQFFSIALLLLIRFVSIQAQHEVPAQINGKLQWKDTTIKKYPSTVKITAKYDPFLISFAEVDSLGQFSAVLASGQYIIEPAIKYHWQRNWEQQFVRINEKLSKVEFAVDSIAKIKVPTLILDTLVTTNHIPEKGILHEFNGEKIQLLNDFIQNNLEYYQVPGASLALFKKGEIVYLKSYGFKNPITKEVVNEKTLFEAGSITKLVFSFAAMRLMEKGVLDLDRPLYKDLKFEAIAHDKRHKLITARHVLSHQTGFPNWAKKDENGHFELLFTPGTKYGYSGEGFEYLKRVMEVITNKDIQTILEEELNGPLGLKNFYFQTTNQVTSRATDGFYQGKPAKMRTIKKPMAAYSLMTNAKDFSIFAFALRNQKGLKRTTYEEWFKEQIIVEGETAWGLGMELRKDQAGHFYGHSGVTRDFVSNFRYYPELDMGFVFFTNNITGGWLTIDKLHQFLITGVEVAE